jgi:hypothetical protein
VTLGHVEGETIALDFRLAKGIADSLPALAAELVLHPRECNRDGYASATLAAFDATRTIPIVMATTAVIRLPSGWRRACRGRAAM